MNNKFKNLSQKMENHMAETNLQFHQTNKVKTKRILMLMIY